MGIVEIEKRFVGRVIGAKGSNLKQIEADFNVRVRVSRDENEVSSWNLLEKTILFDTLTFTEWYS
jgi:predicted PilT family ATPase